MKTMSKIPIALIPKIYEEEVYKLTSNTSNAQEETHELMPEIPIEAEKKEILLISDHGAEDEEFLVKILGAVSLSLEQVDHASTNPKKDIYSKTLNFTDSEEFEKYTPQESNGSWSLYADPLAIIKSDVSLKKKLWAALKVLFLH